MSTHIAHRPRISPALPHQLAGAGIVIGVILTLTGLFMMSVDQSFGLATVGLGAVTGLISSAVFANQRTLERMADVALGDLAIPLPILPSTSNQPHRDIAMLPMGLPAVVALPNGGWGLLPHDVGEAALSWVGFDGAWHRIAEPVRLFQPGDPVSSIGRIPRDGAAVLVDAAWPTPFGVTGRAIRERAERIAVSA